MLPQTEAQNVFHLPAQLTKRFVWTRLEQPHDRVVRFSMEQLRSDFAAMLQPGYWIALGLLVVPYGVGVFFLVRTCHCL
ncbi:hypothetical protein X740_28075 [Mesorhizobium sp. LNHC221B00]|nr:hypothetical protein X742_25965 [Mesorhizobium sp. LNHC232B00]ESY76646.1 hypothetical protein X740_28075 [Mesorhizobium sp. LNHC221B00]